MLETFYNYLYMPVILLPILGYSLCLSFEFGNKSNPIPKIGKKISKIRKIQAVFGLGSSLYSAVK